MKRTVLGIAFIVAVVVGCCLFSTSPAVAGPVSQHLGCPPGFRLVGLVDGQSHPRDVNGDGLVCVKLVLAFPKKIIVVIDNNVP